MPRHDPLSKRYSYRFRWHSDLGKHRNFHRLSLCPLHHRAAHAVFLARALYGGGDGCFLRPDQARRVENLARTIKISALLRSHRPAGDERLVDFERAAQRRVGGDGVGL